MMTQAEYHSRYARDVLWYLLANTTAKRATAFCSKALTVKATRRRKFSKRDWQQEFVVTVGKPNYAERKFIKTCIKAQERFPVKKLQLKFGR